MNLAKKSSKSMNNIKAIIFDFVGVLMHVKSAYKPNKIVDEMDKVIGSVTDDEIFKKEIMKKYNFNETEFYRILDDVVQKYERYNPLWEIIPELKTKYKLAIINNGTALTFPIFNERYKISETFDLFISSAVCGFKKPDKKIYLLASKKLGAKPEDCLFIDDLEENIKGANAVGMKTILWEDGKKGFEEFIKFIKF